MFDEPNPLVRRPRKGGRRLLCFSGELRDRAGISESMIQHWLKAGMLVPVGEHHSGRGNPRMFPEREVIVARLLRACAEIPMPLSRLSRLAEVFRGVQRQRRPAKPLDPTQPMPDTALVRRSPAGGWEAGLAAPPPHEIAPARERDRLARIRTRRAQDLGSAIARAQEGTGTNFMVLAVAPGNDLIHAGTSSDDEGALSFEPVTFLAEADAYFAQLDMPASFTTIVMIDLSILRGLLD
jgi:DNA-binding transcriptional MerR regulator